VLLGAKKTAEVAASIAAPDVSRQLQRLRFVFMNVMSAEGLPRLEGDARVTTLVNDSGYRAFLTDRLVRQAAELTGASEACLLVSDPRWPKEAVVAAMHGIAADVIGSLVEFDPDRPIRGATAVPIEGADGLRGRLELDLEGPSKRDRRLLARQAQLLRHALDHAGMPDSMRASIQGEAETLAEAMDADAGHVLPRAAAIQLVLDVGAELGLPDLALVEVELVALLADIGRFGAEDSAEAAAVAGGEAISQVPGLQPVSTILRHAAERWDGGGGPDGLAGERIPQASRVLAACWPLRDVWPPTIEDLHAESGAAFDPDVVEVLAAVLERRRGRRPAGS
jgi:hypothetical protein